MKRRCYDHNFIEYPRYGGRGIWVYEPWIRDYPAFAKYIRESIGEKPSPQHSLDRINGERGYEPGNLRWATPTLQSSNRRTNRVIEFNNQRMTLAQWARRLGICHATLRQRLDNWPLEKALTHVRGDDIYHSQY